MTTQVFVSCGGNASRIWAWMQDQEACKRYGPNGSIVHTAAGIAAALCMDEGEVKSALFALIVGGFIRYDQKGDKVKAA